MREQKIKIYITNKVKYDGKLEEVKEIILFPNGWVVNDECININHNVELIENYYEWVKSLFRDINTIDEC